MEFTSEAPLCQYLHQRYNRIYLPAETLPLPYCRDKGKVRAIVLGTDPSNPDRIFLERVFGLEDPDSPYFRTVRDNLERIGLSLEDVYVQNLCKNYFRKVSAKNPHWGEIAPLWCGMLRRELDDLFDSRIPVLVTAWQLCPVLAPTRARSRPSDFYKNKVAVPPAENELGRNLVPFFRHWYYNLERWGDYREWVKSLV